MSTQQAPQQPYFPPQLTPQPRAKKPWYRRWWAIVLGVLAVLMVLGSLNGGGDTGTPDKISATQVEDTSAGSSDDSLAGTSDETSTDKPVAKAKTKAPAKAPVKVKAPANVQSPPKPKAPAKAAAPELTSGQENALRSAEGYVSMSGFSRKGLIEQLEFEHYSAADAAFAADHVDVNWKHEAAESAKDYVSMSGFSRSGLIEQLEFEGYTHKQAEFGADSVDSGPAEETSTGQGGSNVTSGQANALRTAGDYVSMSGFSRKGLIEQLESEGYSAADAAFAADHVDVNWKHEAAESAKDYVSMSGFSRSGLIEQLEFEGYTHSQAEYGADKAL